MTQPPYGPPPVPPAYAPQPQYGQPQGQPYPQGPQGQPYPQGPQGQPGFGAPQAPKKPFYKKTWFLIVAGIIVLTIIASATKGGGNTDTAESGAAGGESAAPADDAAAEAPEDTTFAIGEAAADGDFSFVVSGVDCSLTEVGNEYIGKKAQGQFCVVDLAVTNIGDAPGTFFGDNTKLLNAEGQEFSADTEAAIYLDNSDSFLEEINPGNTLNSKVVFDVPAGTTPAAIELHDSAFSGGVTVALQ